MRLSKPHGGLCLYLHAGELWLDRNARLALVYVGGFRRTHLKSFYRWVCVHCVCLYTVQTRMPRLRFFILLYSGTGAFIYLCQLVLHGTHSTKILLYTGRED
jgi:hypothetical protein